MRMMNETQREMSQIRQRFPPSIHLQIAPLGYHIEPFLHVILFRVQYLLDHVIPLGHRVEREVSLK